MKSSVSMKKSEIIISRVFCFSQKNTNELIAIICFICS